ncbi:MAG: flagellar basal body rod protein FlgB [Holophagales bacterium]|jgi:flagellar basal-body rod protein FlgB|nr:flagellar basal body rod protein FlgB [Holophagales bacterium]
MFDLLSKNDMVNTMDKAMTVASRRMTLVASNLANIDTPEYRTRDFPFHETLQAILNNECGQPLPIARTNPMHLCGIEDKGLPFSSVDQVCSAYERNDGNDVKLDKETMKLMQTRGSFSQAALFTQSAIRRVFTAIREGAK